MYASFKALIAGLLLLAVSACGKDDAEPTVSQDIALPAAGSGTGQPSSAGEAPLPSGDYPTVELLTSRGRIVLELYPDKAPANVRNFLSYVDSRQYDGTVFHRVDGDLLVQGGLYTPEYRAKAERGFTASESNNGLHNRRGTLAAARRLNDADSAGAQFFINVVDNPQFDFVSAADAGSRGYTVFGRVVEGMDVVDGMRGVPVRAREGVGEAVPVEPIVIQQARQED